MIAPFCRRTIGCAASYPRWQTSAKTKVRVQQNHLFQLGTKTTATSTKQYSPRFFSSKENDDSHTITHLEGYELDHPESNTPPHIAEKIGRNLHLQKGHPLHTIQTKIAEHFGPDFEQFKELSPIVPTWDNFDALLIPADHVSRSKSDTYYLRDDVCLRTHTSAHQATLFKKSDKFLCVGDVYRRDDIDSSHYPIFHQMEGVRVFDSNIEEQEVLEDLQHTLEGLTDHLFGNVEKRWVDAYFPFTHPSKELEIYFQDEWLEVLGCGVVQPLILENAGIDSQQKKAWAFGLGLERLAMVLFDIPDIRLFWSTDPRFLTQFEEGKVSKFVPYSKYPPCYKDISFWLLDEESDSQKKPFHPNDLNELVRGIAGDLVESVELVDQFAHPKTKKESHCYRITYRSMDRNLTNSEIDELQEEVREKLPATCSIELR
jgi:phenylalanyl-tRNA synthetase alpha chain